MNSITRPINTNHSFGGAAINYGEATVQRGRDGSLTLDAGRGDDAINVNKARDGNYNVDVNGQTFKFTAEEMSRLTIKGGSGNDRINVGANVDVPVKVDGGSGHDSISNHANNATIKGGTGNDSIYNTGNNVRNLHWR